jgi:hypothetical protein
MALNRVRLRSAAQNGVTEPAHSDKRAQPYYFIVFGSAVGTVLWAKTVARISCSAVGMFLAKLIHCDGGGSTFSATALAKSPRAKPALTKYLTPRLSRQETPRKTPIVSAVSQLAPIE